jgi:hypothetical protein
MSLIIIRRRRGVVPTPYIVVVVGKGIGGFFEKEYSTK